MTDAPLRRSTWTPAIAGGLLAAGAVVAELIYPVQYGDGTSREPVLHAVYLAAWVVGWALVVVPAAGLRTVLPASRSATIGSWAAVVGAVALGVSGLVQLIGVLVMGDPPVAAFVLLLLAFPVLVVAGVALALAARSSNSLALGLFLLSAAGFLLALLATVDPYHDIGLVGGILTLTGGMAVLGRSTPHRDPV